MSRVVWKHRLATPNLLRKQFGGEMQAEYDARGAKSRQRGRVNALHSLRVFQHLSHACQLCTSDHIAIGSPVTMTGQELLDRNYALELKFRKQLADGKHNARLYRWHTVAGLEGQKRSDAYKRERSAWFQFLRERKACTE